MASGLVAKTFVLKPKPRPAKRCEQWQGLVERPSMMLGGGSGHGFSQLALGFQPGTG